MLADGKEDADVRAAAAHALGAMCVQNAANELTKLAGFANNPKYPSDDTIGIAAIEALGALHPADLAERLAPLTAKDARLPVRRAAQRALNDPGTCR